LEDPFYILCKSHTVLDENHADINHICEICGKRMKAVKNIMLILNCLSFLFFAVIAECIIVCGGIGMFSFLVTVWFNELACIRSRIPDEAWKIKTRSSVSFSAADLV
jgi:hypothetical protein